MTNKHSFLVMCYCFPLATEDTIASGVKRMDEGISKLKMELKNHPKPQEWADKFSEKMKLFLAEGEDKLKKIKDQYQLMEKKFEELSQFYCFDRKKVSMEEFFGDITQFCKDFEVGMSGQVSNFLANFLLVFCRERRRKMPK